MSNSAVSPGAWARISVLLSGADAENVPLQAGLTIAKAFDGQLNTLFAPPDPAELAPWLGEGFMGTVQVAAMDSLKSVAVESEGMARSQFLTLDYVAKSFAVLKSPVWQDLACETRLSDLMVFGAESAKGHGLLAEAFTQVLMEERTGVFVARQALNVGGTAIVAWDGKEPSSRAARRAVPLLKKAGKVIIIGAPIGDRPADLNRLAGYYAAHGITAQVEALPRSGDIVGTLVDANVRHGADYMVAGAFGHSRLREFAFGGTTRALLQNTSLNLYMAH